MLTRRRFGEMAGLAAASAALRGGPARLLGQPMAQPDFRLEIAPCELDLSAKRRIKTVAYNGTAPGPLLRLKQGRPVDVLVENKTADPEIVHWHGLSLPSEIDGAMEEGSPMIPPGGSTRIRFTPRESGCRWYHTHTFAGSNLRKAQYTGQHGVLLIDPVSDPGAYDAEFVLTLHDWQGYLKGSDDGSMMPVYDVSTVNGRVLGFGDPLRVKQGQRVLLHIVNTSPTEVHWLALAGHTLTVIATDGNTLPQPRTVPMLRLGPAERISATVEMNNPGVWVLGEVRRSVQAAGMGIVLEYAGASGPPKWEQPDQLVWDYAALVHPATASPAPALSLPMVFASHFRGHGAQEKWTINGKSYPEGGDVPLKQGQLYRIAMKNNSTDEHPVHLHRHTFQVRRIGTGPELDGLRKDVVVVPGNSTAEVEFLADNPGRTLFHCHQQDHMDMGFMTVFRY